MHAAVAIAAHLVQELWVRAASVLWGELDVIATQGAQVLHRGDSRFNHLPRRCKAEETGNQTVDKKKRRHKRKACTCLVSRVKCLKPVPPTSLDRMA